MGKRSNFARIERDLYNTPHEAVEPLLPWLKPGTRFVDPCYGKGTLRYALEAAGHVFMGGFDLPIDARSHRYGEMAPGEMFVTNPPYWGRPRELHPLIENLSDQAPTWLLMSSDWLFNKSSAELMQRLALVIAVGRVKWIPNSPYVGKDNCAWLLFDRRNTWVARFVGRDPLDPRQQKARQRAPEMAGGPILRGTTLTQAGQARQVARQPQAQRQGTRQRYRAAG